MSYAQSHMTLLWHRTKPVIKCEFLFDYYFSSSFFFFALPVSVGFFGLPVNPFGRPVANYCCFSVVLAVNNFWKGECSPIGTFCGDCVCALADRLTCESDDNSKFGFHFGRICLGR